MEEWKKINGYDGYFVSNEGRVKSYRQDKIDGVVLNPSLDSKGNYLQLSLRVNKRTKMCRVHRLVAESFILNTYGKPQVNHKDCNKKNNKVENLEWVTRNENSKHAFDNGLIIMPTPFKGKFGAEHNKSKQYKLQCPNGGIKVYGSGLEFHRETGLDHTSLSYASRKKLPYKFSSHFRLNGYTLLEVNNYELV